MQNAITLALMDAGVAMSDMVIFTLSLSLTLALFESLTTHLLYDYDSHLLLFSHHAMQPTPTRRDRWWHAPRAS